jgi:hypothetical protein
VTTDDAVMAEFTAVDLSDRSTAIVVWRGQRVRVGHEELYWYSTVRRRCTEQTSPKMRPPYGA